MTIFLMTIFVIKEIVMMTIFLYYFHERSNFYILRDFFIKDIVFFMRDIVMSTSGFHENGRKWQVCTCEGGRG